MKTDATHLYPPIEPGRCGRLAVDAVHTLYWEECGNPQGVPVLFLHGGPGGGLVPAHRRFFDPAFYRIVLFDQRGAGKSTPAAHIGGNSTAQLISDIERLRELLGVQRWLVFGGSWGATLALAYGQAFPERCLGFVLRGIFLCTPAEIDWFLHRMGWFFPEAHEAFVAPIPVGERHDLLAAYGRRLFSADPAVSMPVARAWSAYETACAYLEAQAVPASPGPRPGTGQKAAQQPAQRPVPEAQRQARLEAEHEAEDAASLAISRIEAHYFLNRGFFEDDQLIGAIDRLAGLPAIIVQGRYDVICPPAAAWRLHHAWPGSCLRLVAASGHSAFEAAITAALVEATDRFRDVGGWTNDS